MIQARKYRSSLSLLVLVLAFALVGCPGRGTDKEVMAKVNSYKIFRSELDKNYNARVAGAPQKPTAAEEEVPQRIAQVMIEQKPKPPPPPPPTKPEEKPVSAGFKPV